ncbi:MAG: hypothetical protein ACAI38_04975 [Myxococcota bacterium]
MSIQALRPALNGFKPYCARTISAKAAQLLSPIVAVPVGATAGLALGVTETISPVSLGRWTPRYDVIPAPGWYDKLPPMVKTGIWAAAGVPIFIGMVPELTQLPADKLVEVLATDGAVLAMAGAMLGAGARVAKNCLMTTCAGAMAAGLLVWDVVGREVDARNGLLVPPTPAARHV